MAGITAAAFIIDEEDQLALIAGATFAGRTGHKDEVVEYLQLNLLERGKRSGPRSLFMWNEIAMGLMKEANDAVMKVVKQGKLTTSMSPPAAPGRRRRGRGRGFLRSPRTDSDQPPGIGATLRADEEETDSAEIVITKDRIDRIFAFMDQLPEEDQNVLYLDNYLIFEDIAAAAHGAAVAHVVRDLEVPYREAEEIVEEGGGSLIARKTEARARHIHASLARVRPLYTRGVDRRELRLRQGGRSLTSLILDLYEVARNNPTGRRSAQTRRSVGRGVRSSRNPRRPRRR